MSHVQKIKSVQVHRVGRLQETSILASIEELGYTTEEARELIEQGRVLKRCFTNDKYAGTGAELYVLDPKEESTESEEFVDRGHLVDLE